MKCDKGHPKSTRNDYIIRKFIDAGYPKENLSLQFDVDLTPGNNLEQQQQLEQDMAPFGFVDDGINDPMGESVVDEYGQRWSPVVRNYDSSW